LAKCDSVNMWPYAKAVRHVENLYWNPNFSAKSAGSETRDLHLESPKLSLGLPDNSMALSQLQSRDTVPLRSFLKKMWSSSRLEPFACIEKPVLSAYRHKQTHFFF
jgi:hypothetical protein